ncbi:MAG: hypothetical protein ACO3P4_02270 [Polynucleobacter sp.]
MTIDTRHWVFCNLGPLAAEPSNFADDHLQGGGGGVIMTKGTINLNGIYRPAPGAEVWFAISDGQSWIARIPRKLRVLNSFADPLRNITTVLVGCKFAYMENRRPPITNLTEPEANSDVPEIDRRAFTQAIKASTVAEYILTTLGLTAAGAIPFTNARIIDEWDLSNGFVQELATIAEAECYRCRINENEQVEFISLNQEVGTGSLITQFDLIELTPQTVGELPADTVYAKYESTQLKPPDNDPNDSNDEDKRKKRNWERDESFTQEYYAHTYELEGESITETGFYNRTSINETKYDLQDRVAKRTETSTELMGTRTAVTTFEYEAAPPSPDPVTGKLPPPNPALDYTVVKTETYTEESPLGDIASSCGFNGSLGSFRALGTAPSNIRITSYDRERSTGISRTFVKNKVLFINAPWGSDVISKLSQDLPDNTDTNYLSLFSGILNIASNLVSYGDELRIRTEREYGLQKRPGQQERNKAADQKTPSIEQQAEIVWAVGSATSQTALELSPPYVSDDQIIKLGPGSYIVKKSDAAQKALNYATTENRLLLANRAGAGVQLRPIDAPPKPFDLFYIRLNGCTAAYRVNGTSWTFNSDGVIVSIDGLFWGAIDGQVNKAWFPLPPGATALPATAGVTINANPKPANAIAIPSGFNPLNPNLTSLFASLPVNQAPIYRAILNPSIIVKPYTETISLFGGVQVGGGFELQTWVPLEQEIGGGVKVGGGFEMFTPLGTGYGVKEIAMIGTGLGIKDDLPVPTYEFYQFTSSSYNTNGYVFNNLFRFFIMDDTPNRFRRFADVSTFIASYDPSTKEFILDVNPQTVGDFDRIKFELRLLNSNDTLYVKSYRNRPYDFPSTWDATMVSSATNAEATTIQSNFISGFASDGSYSSTEYPISDPFGTTLASLYNETYMANTPPSGFSGSTTPGGFRIYLGFY